MSGEHISLKKNPACVTVSLALFDSFSNVPTFIIVYRCENGGTCVDGVDGYTCTCPDGLTGHSCECAFVDERTINCTGVVTTNRATTTATTTTEDVAVASSTIAEPSAFWTTDGGHRPFFVTTFRTSPSSSSSPPAVPGDVFVITDFGIISTATVPFDRTGATSTQPGGDTTAYASDPVTSTGTTDDHYGVDGGTTMSYDGSAATLRPTADRDGWTVGPDARAPASPDGLDADAAGRRGTTWSYDEAGEAGDGTTWSYGEAGEVGDGTMRSYGKVDKAGRGTTLSYGEADVAGNGTTRSYGEADAASDGTTRSYDAGEAGDGTTRSYDADEAGDGTMRSYDVGETGDGTMRSYGVVNVTALWARPGTVAESTVVALSTHSSTVTAAAAVTRRSTTTASSSSGWTITADASLSTGKTRSTTMKPVWTTTAVEQAFTAFYDEMSTDFDYNFTRFDVPVTDRVPSAADKSCVNVLCSNGGVCEKSKTGHKVSSRII